MSALMKQPHRLTQLLLIMLALGVWGLLIVQLFPSANASAKTTSEKVSADFETINVERINVVDPDGTIRMAIGNRAHPPEARLRGKVYERSIEDIVGIVFYEANGDETGGLGVAKLRDNKQRAIIFDYTHQFTDGVGMINRESEDGKTWEAGFFISDRRPYAPGDITSSQGVERIWLKNEDKNAALVISDPEGRERIRIGVDEAGEPAITMMDEEGNIIYAADVTK